MVKGFKQQTPENRALKCEDLQNENFYASGISE